MQAQGFKAFFGVIVALCAAVFLTVSLFSTEGNVLGKTYLYLAVVAFLIGVLSPKAAVYSILFCSGYIDLFKRLMVVYGQPSQLDVAFIQSIPPALMAGAIISTLIAMFFLRHPLTRRLWAPLIFCVLFSGVTTFSTSEWIGGFLRYLQSLVNQSLYPFLLVLVPVYFRDVNEMRKLLVYTFVIYIPVALYMFRHYYFGLADFEHAYLLTGLTQEARILWENKGALRGFSTMSGAGIVSVMMSVLILMCFVSLPPGDRPVSRLKQVGKWLLAPVFFMAAYFTVTRGGWFCGVAAIVAYVMFGRRSTTVTVYVLGICAFLALVVAAPTIQKARVLENSEQWLKSAFATSNDAYVDRALVLGTANDRLSGLVNLTQMKGLWTPFGWKLSSQSEMVHNMQLMAQRGDFSIGHDMVVDMVINVGYVPMTFILILVGAFLVKMHRFLLSLPKESMERKVMRLAVALAIGIVFGGFGNAAQAKVFPLNFFIWLFLSLGYALYLHEQERVALLRRDERLRIEEEAARRAPVPTGLPGAVSGA